MTLTRLERETTINFNDGEDEASIYSASPTIIRRLKKRLGRAPDRSGHYWAEWVFPRKWVTLPRLRKKRAGVPQNLMHGRARPEEKA